MTIEEVNTRFNELIETAAKATGQERALYLYRESEERVNQFPKYELQSQEQRDDVIMNQALLAYLCEIAKNTCRSRIYTPKK